MYEKNKKKKIHEGRFLSGFTVGNADNHDLMISHLLFSHDTLLFSDANPNKIGHLGYILTWFEAISSLNMNLGKSELAPVGDGTKYRCLGKNLGTKNMCLTDEIFGSSFRSHIKSKFHLEHYFLENGKKIDGMEAVIFVYMRKNYFDQEYPFQPSNIFLQIGRLAVKNLKLFKQALFGKKLWCFGREREAIWSR